MPPGKPRGKASGLKFSPWNLVLLVPLLILVTPLYNFTEPRLLGLPFFYWAQLGFVVIGVLSVGIVYVKTRDVPAGDGSSEHRNAADHDEGEGR